MPMIAVWLFVHFRNDQTLRYRMHGKAQDAVVACSFWGGGLTGVVLRSEPGRLWVSLVESDSGYGGE